MQNDKDLQVVTREEGQQDVLGEDEGWSSTPVWNWEDQTPSGGETSHTEENIHKMDEFIFKQGLFKIFLAFYACYSGYKLNVLTFSINAWNLNSNSNNASIFNIFSFAYSFYH